MHENYTKSSHALNVFCETGVIGAFRGFSERKFLFKKNNAKGFSADF